MALAPTLHDYDLTLSHVDRSLDVRVSLKVARHPSESVERVWLRVLAWCWQWEEGIAFGPGLCDPDAPDLYADAPTGEKRLWIRVGRPEPVRVKREAERNGRARVAVLFDSPRAMERFAAEAADGGVKVPQRVELAAVDAALLRALTDLDERRVKVTVTLVGDHFYVEAAGRSVDGPLTHAAR